MLRGELDTLYFESMAKLAGFLTTRMVLARSCLGNSEMTKLNKERRPGTSASQVDVITVNRGVRKIFESS
jgi:hypothetical protein